MVRKLWAGGPPRRRGADLCKRQAPPAVIPKNAEVQLVVDKSQHDGKA